MPKNLVAVNPHSTTQLGYTEIVNTRRGTDVSNSDNNQKQFMDPISEGKKDDEPAIAKRRPLGQEAVSIDKADEPSLLTSGQIKRNVRKPDRYGHNICELIGNRQTIIQSGGRLPREQQETPAEGQVVWSTSPYREGRTTPLPARMVYSHLERD